MSVVLIIHIFPYLISVMLCPTIYRISTFGAKCSEHSTDSFKTWFDSDVFLFFNLCLRLGKNYKGATRIFPEANSRLGDMYITVNCVLCRRATWDVVTNHAYFTHWRSENRKLCMLLYYLCGIFSLEYDGMESEKPILMS